MIIHTTNIIALPMILLIWAIDIYLLLAGIRLILRHIPAASGVCQGIAKFTDPVPDAIGRWLTSRRHKPVPTWLPWLLICIAAVLIRQLLILMVFGTH